MQDIDVELIKLLSRYVDFTAKVGELYNRGDKCTGYSRGWWDAPYGAPLPNTQYPEFEKFYNEHWPDNGGILITGTRFAGIDHNVFGVIVPYDDNKQLDYNNLSIVEICIGVT